MEREEFLDLIKLYQEDQEMLAGVTLFRSAVSTKPKRKTPMKHCYIVKQIYKEHTQGENWVTTHRTLKEAIKEFLCDAEGGSRQIGQFDPDTDEVIHGSDLNVYDADNELLWDNSKPFEPLDCGDYSLRIEKV